MFQGPGFLVFRLLAFLRIRVARVGRFGGLAYLGLRPFGV